MLISRRNRRGVLLLILGLIVLSYTPRLIGLLKTEEKPSITFREAKILESEILYDDYQLKEKKYRKPKKSYKVPSSKFDPNDYDQKDWIALGLSEKQAAVVVRFSERGLRSNDDLQKIYVIPSQLYELIKDSTVYVLPQSGKKTKKTIEKKKSKKEILIYLNTSDKEELQRIPGIGDYFSKKIVAYREKLGGFERKEQLMEVWHLDAAKYDEIKNYIEIDYGNLTKLSINNASLDELKSHPYINYNVANSIVKMRTQKGSYSQLEDLLDSKLIDRVLFKKIKPYLSL